MTKNELLRAIEDRREAVGLSVPEVCRRAGVSPATYNGWMRGSHDPQLDYLTAVMAALYMTIQIKHEKILDVNPCARCEVRDTCEVTCRARAAYDKRWEDAHHV